MFPISRDPPEGGTSNLISIVNLPFGFPISRDPPEGGTSSIKLQEELELPLFPISRDPPEGGTGRFQSFTCLWEVYYGFQFLGIPPKGERAFGCEHR